MKLMLRSFKEERVTSHNISIPDIDVKNQNIFQKVMAVN